MEPEIRFIAEDRYADWMRAEMRGFGVELEDARLQQLLPLLAPSRIAAALDGDEIVATGAVFTTTLTLPGGATLPVGAITGIGTKSTHKRQGLFRRMMSLLHEDSASRGEPATVLLASEAQLYPRFGYGHVTSLTVVEFARRRCEFRAEVLRIASGRVRLIEDREVIRRIVTDVEAAARPTRPGWVGRTQVHTDFLLADHEADRDGAMPFTVAVHENSAGIVDGYCLYRHRPKWNDGMAEGSMHISELVALTSEARLRLWQHCLDIDLVETVTGFGMPVDEILPHALVDRRQYRVKAVGDWLWVRPTDCAALVTARRYAESDTVTVHIEEVGRFRIEGGPSGATCQPTDDEADLRCDRGEFASILLGGDAVRPLFATGRIQLADPATVGQIDRFFRWPITPFCLFDF